MRRTTTLLLTLTVTILAIVLTPSAATAAPPTTGQVRVVVTAAPGVPGTVALNGPQTAAVTKPPSGTTTTTVVTVQPGTYRLTATPTVHDGTLFKAFFLRGGTQVQSLPVRAGETAQVAAVYVAVPGARAVVPTAIEQDRISWSWSGPTSATYSMRRTTGDVPAATRTEGSAVPVSGRTATDSGLQPGTTYSYALFSRVDGSWNGPFVVTAGTAPAPGSTDAAFIAAPGTLIASATDVQSATTTGAGVRAVLSPGVGTRVIGSAVVLPISDSLPGGFLGVVTAVSADGRTVELRAGGIGDGFDYYSLDVADVTPEAPTEDGGFGTFSVPEDAPTTDPAPSDPSQRTPIDPGADDAGDATFATAAAAGLLTCDAGLDTVQIQPSITLGGAFSAVVDTQGFAFVSVPVGAEFDMTLTATLTAAVGISTTVDGSCQLNLKPVVRQLSVYPVPMAFTFAPSAELTFGAGISATSLGFTATAGVAVSGQIRPVGQDVSASRIAAANPLTPVVTAEGDLGLELAGVVAVGPGGGTGGAGVLAAVKGTLTVLDATATGDASVGASGATACLRLQAGWAAGLALTAKAWLGKWSAEREFSHPALQFDGQYGNSPWVFPAGCDQPTPTTPSDSILGPGVTQVSQSSTGSPDQIGYVQGFVPGQRTWVASSGLSSSVPGSPSTLASTSLGLPGDEVLSELSGQATYDAASYEVVVVPTGSTLNVRYAFASEEYPEYVGSPYNDVMAVLVDGVNCAALPGTDTPVSINTVNPLSNSAFYVDNTDGAAGYDTVMDGLTVPLTCSVSVTPGVPVSVRIAVADASDRILDSAVALLDGGIWSS